MYAIFTKHDFTTGRGLMVVFAATMMMFFMFFLLAWTPILHTLYCCLGLFLFGFYLVIDTQMIIGNKRLGISIDDYVVGALLLYIDIIQIFIYILSLLGGGKKWFRLLFDFI